MEVYTTNSVAAANLSAGRVLNAAGTNYEATGTAANLGIIKMPAEAGEKVTFYASGIVPVEADDASTLTIGELVKAGTDGKVVQSVGTGDYAVGQVVAKLPDGEFGDETVSIRIMNYVSA